MGFHRKNCAHIVCSRGGRDVGTAAQRDGFAGWVAVFVLISLLVNVRTSVQIIDNSDLVKVHRVDNVPVGLAMPLSLTTRIGHAMVASYEMIFTQPDSVTYSKTGMLFGAGNWYQKAPTFCPAIRKSPIFFRIMCRTV